MSGRDRDRLDAFRRVRRRELTVVDAAALLGVSVRQARRLWKRFQSQGDGGLVHRLRGRASNRRLPEEFRQRVVKRHQECYADFGPTMACEKLALDGLPVSPDTLVNLLKAQQLWTPRRKRKQHRQRRERKASFGTMAQMDGSHHPWFEDRAGKCVLMVIIDDATNRAYARLYPAETTAAAFDVFGRWAKKYGVPRIVYVDRHSIYRDPERPEKPTQFKRAMNELGVELIGAHSPQAKGRVERRHAVFQDRLVKELRLRNISDMEQANAFLETMFLEDLNRRYAVAARHAADLHRPLPPDLKLEEILCVQEPRTVGRDWCVRWHNQWLQIPAQHVALDLPGKKIVIKQPAGGPLVVTYQGMNLSYTLLPARPMAARNRTRSRTRTTVQVEVKPAVTMKAPPAAGECAPPAGTKAAESTRVVHVNRRPNKPGPRHPWRHDPVGRRGSGCSRPAPAAPPQVGCTPTPA